MLKALRGFGEPSTPPSASASYRLLQAHLPSPSTDPTGWQVLVLIRGSFEPRQGLFRTWQTLEIQKGAKREGEERASPSHGDARLAEVFSISRALFWKRIRRAVLMRYHPLAPKVLSPQHQLWGRLENVDLPFATAALLGDLRGPGQWQTQTAAQLVSHP